MFNQLENTIYCSKPLWDILYGSFDKPIMRDTLYGSFDKPITCGVLRCLAVSCGVLRCLAVSCGVLRCLAVISRTGTKA